MDVLIIYQFCTFGGVERVILNRAHAFRKYGLDVTVSIGYLYDRGALSSFCSYIQAHNLQKKVIPFILPKGLDHEWDQYDIVFIVDTPQVFDASASAKNVHVECHTPYIRSRQYLRVLSPHIKSIITPSHTFKVLLESEFENLPEIHVFPNPIPDVYFNSAVPERSIFTHRPITYFARVEDLKNFNEAVRIFETLTDQAELMYWVIGENAGEKQIIQSLERKGLLHSSLLRDRVGFDQVPELIRLVKKHLGIFLSPSKGESFGLSAAEFISGGVPVLLSDIPSHVELVNADERFIYPLGDIFLANKKLLWLCENWEEASQIMTVIGKKFESIHFIKAWNSFIKKYE